MSAIFNSSKNSSLASRVVIANNPLTRIVGLLGRKDFSPGEALIIKPCFQVHTFFMRFPIDILFVNRENKIIAAISDLKPFRVTAAYFNAAFVVELPVGTILSSRTAVGDNLSF